MSGWRVRVRLGIAALLLAAIAAGTVGAPWLATHDPQMAATDTPLEAPSRAHLMGTDLLGRDVFSRVMWGGRRTLGVALLTALITLGPGLMIGLAAGYGGRWLDGALMTLVDAMLAFPTLLLALALLVLLGQGTVPVAAAVGIAGIGGYARVTRAAVIGARGLQFVEAARAIGAGPMGILRRHILPAAAPTLLSFAGVTLSWAILNSAALMFLGYGGDIAAAAWGVMLADARQTFRMAPWTALAPGVALSVTVMALNLLARALDEWSAPSDQQYTD